jgi:hypothetical protein
MGAAYFRAAIPEPYRILGRHLHPFSLGHYIILKRFGCAFVADEAATATREDLIFGVFVCSLTYEEFHEWLNRKDLFKKVKKWGKKVGVFDLPSKAALFQEYIKAGQEHPKFWLEQEDDKPSGAHWVQSVITALTGSLGYSRSEALNAPLCQSLFDFYKHAENLGVVTIIDDETAARIEQDNVPETTSGNRN